MRLVVNTNRIIAALIRDSTSRKIIMSGKIELVTPKFSQKEIKKHKDELVSKAKITNKQFDQLLSILLTKIYSVDDEITAKKMRDAKMIIGSIDSDDEPFISLALAITNDGIWTDDRHFLEQKFVKIYTTADLITMI